MIAKDIKSKLIKTSAFKYGFDNCGIAKAAFLEDDALRFEKWLKENQHGSMSYMAKHFDKRLNPKLLVEDTKYVISFVYGYAHPFEQITECSFKIAKYALINDYHFFIKQKLNALIEELKSKLGDFTAKVFVDSAPVLEKSWAVKAGLGFVGKNSQLIVPHKGSFFFLAQILTDLEIQADNSCDVDFCKSCNKCIEACPSLAINSNRTINASKCISYLTIEKKEPLNSAEKQCITNQLFGCDICLNVCPLNKTNYVNKDVLQFVKHDILEMNDKDFIVLNDTDYKQIIKTTPMSRLKFEKFLLNKRHIFDKLS